MIQKILRNNYQGIIEIPPSKSDSQRAILCAGLAFGNSILSNVGDSDDEKAMISTIRSFGARLQILDEKKIEIRGVGGLNLNSIQYINLGESGLGARLLTSIAATANHPIELTGKGSLMNRNMSFFGENLPKMGVKTELNDQKLPITVQGPLLAGNYEVDGSESSQYISGLLMALPLAQGNSILSVQNLKSRPYVQMTLKTLKHFGIEIDDIGDDTFSMKGDQTFSGTNYTIDGDWSSASYWLVASAIGANIKVKGLSMQSLQADRAMLDALLVAGCRITHETEAIFIDGQHRKPFTFNATDCPDLFPALVSLACLTPGVSILKGTHRLQNKESNRAFTLKSEFEKLGVRIDLINDEMHIFGVDKVKGGNCSSHHDHRIAMCLAIVGIFSDEGIEIEGAEAVAKSYPRFWDDLYKLIS